jgi:hypothetical protein
MTREVDDHGTEVYPRCNISLGEPNRPYNPVKRKTAQFWEPKSLFVPCRSDIRRILLF